MSLANQPKLTLDNDTMNAQTDAFFRTSLADADAEIFSALQEELNRQQTQIELIASENIVSNAVLRAQGSVLTNKYAEGYPGKRYYGGCEFADKAERLAIDRAKKIFGCTYVNVQPNSGSQANQGVFNALLKPGDTILGQALAAGGHLTVGQNLQRYSVRRARRQSSARLRPDRKTRQRT